MSKAIGASIGLTGFVAILFFGLFAFGMTIYGLYLAFSASIILGIIAFVVEPSPLVFGIVMFFFDKNLPELIIKWLNS